MEFKINLKIHNDDNQARYTYSIYQETLENETVSFSIQFIAQDMDRQDETMNAWIMFFNGVTAVTGNNMVTELKEYLKKIWK